MLDTIEGLEILPLIHHDATVVQVSYLSPDLGLIRVTGHAKRHPDDKHDPVVAYNLALSRAMVRLARKLSTRVRGKIHDNDHSRFARLENKRLVESNSSKPHLFNKRYEPQALVDVLAPFKSYQA